MVDNQRKIIVKKYCNTQAVRYSDGMNTKCTPGPWIVKGSEIFDGVNELPIGKAYHVFYRKGSDSIISPEANARLMAAAPELLEALLSLCIQMEGTLARAKAERWSLMQGDYVPLRRAQAAVSKACGVCNPLNTPKT